MSEHPFSDPVSGEVVILHVGDSAGVEHPGCAYRAEVSPELDAFYCRHCQRNGRVNGTWVIDLIHQSQAMSDLPDDLRQRVQRTQDVRCARCGTDEDRLDGYCSTYCQDMHPNEQRIAQLEAVVEAVRESSKHDFEVGRAKIWDALIILDQKEPRT